MCCLIRTLYPLKLIPMLKEGETGIIELKEDEPNVVLAVLMFLYGKPYNIPDDIAPAEFHAQLYAAGDFYQLPLLKKCKSESSMSRSIPVQEGLGTNANIDALKSFKDISKEYECSGPKACFHAARTVYSATPKTDRGLRDVLVSAVHDHIESVIDEEEGNQNILRDIPELAYDLAMIRARTVPHIKGAKLDCFCVCLACRSFFAIAEHSSHSRFSRKNGNTSVKCPVCGKQERFQLVNENFQEISDDYKTTKSKGK